MTIFDLNNIVLSSHKFEDHRFPDFFSQHIETFEKPMPISASHDQRQMLRRAKSSALENICSFKTHEKFPSCTQSLLKNKNFTDFDFSELNLSGFDLSSSTLLNAKLVYANLTNANFSHANLYMADLSGTELKHANFTDANLTKANLLGAKLKEVSLTGATLTDISVDVGEIQWLPLSDTQKYLMHINTIKLVKTPHVYAQEHEAITELKQSLNQSVPSQARLAALDTEQLQLLLPCIYVESNHRLDPTIAYNTKDNGKTTLIDDDNVAMIKGYARFLRLLNTTFSGDNRQAEQEVHLVLQQGIKDLFLLFTGSALFSQYVCFRANPKYLYITSETDADNDVDHHGIFRLKHLTIDITLGHAAGRYGDTLILFEGISDRREENMTKALAKFTTEIIKAYVSRDKERLFNLTSDFQYLHLFPNANGRVSQIIRDCFALLMNDLPYSALHTMSHYMYLLKPAEPAHLQFMQGNTEELLVAVEKKALTGALYRRNGDAQRDKLAATAEKLGGAVQHDIKNFLA